MRYGQSIHNVTLSAEHFDALKTLIPVFEQPFLLQRSLLDHFPVFFSESAKHKPAKNYILFLSAAFDRQKNLAIAEITINMYGYQYKKPQVHFHDLNIKLTHEALLEADEYAPPKICDSIISDKIMQIIFGVKETCCVFWVKDAKGSPLLTIFDSQPFANGQYAQVHNALSPAYPEKKYVVRYTTGRDYCCTDPNVIFQFREIEGMSVIRAEPKKAYRVLTIMTKGKEDLESYLKRRMNQLTPQEMFEICILMAHELYRLHGNDIAHLDVKPANFIVISEKPLHIVLGDHDFAKKNIRERRLMQGTFYYLQAGMPTNQQADSFAFRRTCYMNPKFKMLRRFKRPNEGSCAVIICLERKNETALKWIISDDVLNQFPHFKAIMSVPDCEQLDHVNMTDILSALILTKHNLYEVFGSVGPPEKIKQVVLEYHDKNPDCVLLQNELVKNIITQIATCCLDTSSNLTANTWIDGLLQRLRNHLLPQLSQVAENTQALFGASPKTLAVISTERVAQCGL